MRVCLIYSGIGVAGFNNNRPKGDREGSWIAHGIASIGAFIKDRGLDDVSFIDLRQLTDFEEFKLKLKYADVYGISISAVDYYSAIKAIIDIKSIYPKSKIIVGGIHPTIFPEKYNIKIIDTIVKGEGELTFYQLIRLIEKKAELPKFINGDKPDLDYIPYIDRELFDYRRELSCNFAPNQETPSITMLAGRGCAFKCTYCQPAENSVFGHPYRMRSPENVIQEIEILKQRYNFKSITFWDDTFTFSSKWIEKFCKLYTYKIPFAACSRADIICNHEEVVKHLSEAGCEWLVIGFESGSQRILDLIQKGTTVEQNIKAAKICRKYGIKIFGTFMYGLPTETKEDSLATYNMIKEISPEHPSPFFFLPIDGTEIHKYCYDNDLILDNVKDRTIARTGVFTPALKNIDYDYIRSLVGN